VPSLLVTNDFPPKHGGIQSYLWELWRRMPADDVAVLTATSPGDRAFDAAQDFPIERFAARVLWPTRRLARRIDDIARARGADLVFLDPALPLGHLGRWLSTPYLVVAHGAEITVPGRLPLLAPLLRRVITGAAGVVAAGGYPAGEVVRVARRPVPGLVIPPGVDTERFHPAPDDERGAARSRFGLAPDEPLVLGVSRFVPRKGFDVLIDALARLTHSVRLAIAGDGRDHARLRRRVERRGLGERVTLLGRVPDADLAALYGCADVFAMLCRSRWGGLEQEGFGIVFLEAAACGVPAVAGRSGGAHEAVVDGTTGFVVTPRDADAVAGAIAALLDDRARRHSFGAAARRRAETEFTYDALAARLRPLAAGDLSALGPLPAVS
jgi:phosphatidylinositol alpha-1,6-mannosyltransferase